MNTKRIIPDLFTCGNLLSGSIAVLMATQGQFKLAFLFILLGVFFDFFDGMTARALNVVNATGVELDSLADEITSGLAPSMMLCCYLYPLIGWWSLIALVMVAFSAIRLAKFNTDERQKTGFIGLATPANALFWGGITCMPQALMAWHATPWILLLMSLLSCYLLISEIPFFSLKFHDLTWKNNYRTYIFLIGCVLLILFCIVEAVRFHEMAYACFAGTICILWYVTYNLITLRSRQE